MTKPALKWKLKIEDDDETWMAKASFTIGGRYQIYTEWRGDFRVAYEDPDHDYDWHILDAAWPNFEAAKAAAEANHSTRRAAMKRRRADEEILEGV